MVSSVNWLDTATRSIHSRHPEAAGCADYLSQRLSALLLERLPPDIARELVALLPEISREILERLDASAESSGPAGEASIGYEDFVDRTAFALGCSGAIAYPADSENFEAELRSVAKQVTDTFLWAFAHEVPPELKAGMIEALPVELRSRMNLYESSAPESRVA